MDRPQQILKKAERGQVTLVGTGIFAQVVRINNTELAVKIPFNHGEHNVVEKRIYDRLGCHPFILRCYGESDKTSIVGKGLMLQYHPEGTLAEVIDNPTRLSAFADKRTG